MDQFSHIYSERITSGNRTYILDIKQSKSGERYMTIAENKKVSAGGYVRSSVMVFEENLESFLTAMHKLVTHLAQA